MRLFFKLLLLLSFITSLPAHASTQDEIANLKRLLSQLPTEEITPEVKQQRDSYQQLLSAYQEALQLDEKSAQLKATLERQPANAKRLQELLNQTLPPISIEHYQQKSSSELEQILTLEKARLLELEQNRDLLTQQIKQSDVKLINLRDQLATLKQDTLINSVTSSSLNDAQFTLRAAKIQALELEVLSIPGKSELNRLSLLKANKDITQQQSLIEGVQDLLQAKRRIETERTLSLLSTDNIDVVEQDPVITNLINNNLALSESLRETLDKTDKAVQQRRLLEVQLAIVNQSYTSVQQQLELSTQPLGIELRKFTRRLSKLIQTDETRQSINQLRLLNLDTTSALIESESTEIAKSLDKETLKQFKQLNADKQNLLNRIREASNQGITDLSQLLTTQEQINKQIVLGRELIAQHLLWIPSTLPISSNWANELILGIPALISYLKPVATVPLFEPVYSWIPDLVAFALLVVLAALLNKHYRSKRELWAREIGNVVHDRFLHTFNLLWMPMAITAPVPVAIMLVGENVFNLAAFNIDSPTLIIRSVALLSWIYLSLLYWLSMPYGLLHAHLAVPQALCKTLKKLLHPLFWLSVPLIVLTLLIDPTDSTELRSGLGRLVLILLAGIVTLFWGALWKVAPQINQITHGDRWWQQAQLWLASLVGIHVLLILATLLGYLFTASMIMLVLLILTGILYTTFIFFKLGNRWLLMEERHVEFDRAKLRRNEIMEAREKNEEIPPLNENYINLQNISDQARVLLKTITVIVFVSMCWAFLKNALPTLDILDSVVLWSNDVTTSSGIISESITLKNIVFSTALITLCILAAYNLPGLLELLLLRHLTLSQGTSYAITSITKYILIVFSILSGASQLGLEWSKLHWLIAALGVGLGFGLQEIVANFVSGLIILFEKPIRIGDTVTIGGFTGNVTRIQIRATTISDWDRKEVIIPNKNFVTDQLINWSLTDPITRVVFKVGVAYGSDTQLAQQLLLEAAKAHPKVLKEPTPDAFFMAFGASTLDLELRLYVNSLSDRLAVTHEINQAIDSSFKAHNIEIAFPQVDVHLHRPKKS
jgi:potassium efflux system protein